MSTILWGTFQSVVCLGSPQSTRPYWLVTGSVHVPLENQIIISFKSSRLIIIPRNIISYHNILKIIISLRIWRNWPIDSLYMPISSTHVDPFDQWFLKSSRIRCFFWNRWNHKKTTWLPGNNHWKEHEMFTENVWKNMKTTSNNIKQLFHILHTIRLWFFVDPGVSTTPPARVQCRTATGVREWRNCHRKSSECPTGWSFSLPSAKHTKNYGKSPFWMGKSTISMVIVNSYVKLPEGIWGFLK